MVFGFLTGLFQGSVNIIPEPGAPFTIKSGAEDAIYNDDGSQLQSKANENKAEHQYLSLPPVLSLPYHHELWTV